MTIQVNELPNYLEDYLEEMQIKGLTNKTLKNYEFAISAFIKYIETEKQELQEIDKTNLKRIIKDYKKYRKNVLNNKNSSINNYLIQIMAFLNNYDVKTALGFDERDKIKIDLLIENKVLNKKSKDHIDKRSFYC